MMLNKRKSRCQRTKINAILCYYRIKHCLNNVYSNVDIDITIFKLQSLLFNRAVNTLGREAPIDLLNFYGVVAAVNAYQSTIVYLLGCVSSSLQGNPLPSYKFIAEQLGYACDNFNYLQRNQNEIIWRIFCLWFMWIFGTLSFCTGASTEDKAILLSIRSDNPQFLISQHKTLFFDNNNLKVKINSIFCRAKHYSLSHLANVSNAHNIKEIIAFINKSETIFDPIFDILFLLSTTKNIPEQVMKQHLLPFLRFQDWLNLYWRRYNEEYRLLGFKLQPSICKDFLHPVMNNFIDEMVRDKYDGAALTFSYANYLRRSANPHNDFGKFVDAGRILPKLGRGSRRDVVYIV